jgi:hypothetical protein
VNEELDDLFGDRPVGQKMGSYNCPTCGRFAKIVRVGNDSNPEYYYESYYIVTDCRKCGIGQTS